MDTVTTNTSTNVIYGTEGDDLLQGHKLGATVIYGLGGNDTFRSYSGADTLHGGSGNDIFHISSAGSTIIEHAGEGNDTVVSTVSYNAPANVEKVVLTGSADIDVIGHNGNNLLFGNSGNNRVTGREGRDRLYGQDGNDLMNGGAGDDELYGGAGRDRIYGQDGNDYLDGGDGDDALEGGNGNDRLMGGAGNDNLKGGNGNDILNGGIGKDVMSGQAGNDIYYVDHIGDTVIEQAGEGNDTVVSSVSYSAPANVEKVVLTGSADIDVIGHNGNNLLFGNSGNNRVTGREGRDRLYGQDGNDLMNGGAGDDELYGGAGRDRIYGQDGNDYLDGGDSDDALEGGNGNDRLVGGSGNDNLDGGSGNDLLLGGAGNDVYRFGKGYGHDIVRDTEGKNIVRLMGLSSKEITVSASGDKWVLTVKSSGETLTIENQTADSHATVTRFEFSDGIFSNEDLAKAAGLITQTNTIIGTDSDDRLIGTDQDDVLSGLGGNDVIQGGKGVDIADGGSGDDAFIVLGDLRGGSQSTNPNHDALLGQPLANLAGKDYQEAQTGDVFKGGEGNDTLYAFGTIDLSQTVLDSIERIEMPSDVSLSAEQLASVTVFGGGVGTLRIKDAAQETKIVLSDNQLNDVKQLSIGKNVVIEVKNADTLNGTEIISGGGTLKFTETTALSTNHSVSADVQVVNADGSSAKGDAEVLDQIISATDDDAVHTTVDNLPYKDMLSDAITNGNAPVTVLDGSGGNDYIEGGSTHDALNGKDGDDVLVGRSGNDIFVINSSGKKTIIDNGTNQDIDTIVFDGAKEGVEIDLSDFTGRIGNDTLIQIGASDSTGVAKASGDKTNLMLIIDRSGSMGWGPRMENAKDAAIKLLDKYSQLGDVAVRVIGFDGYSYVTFNGVNSWMNKADAVNAINSLYANGGTDYYVALNAAETAFVSNRNGVFHDKGQNFSMFLSDGEPNTYLSMTRQTQWEDFVIKHKIVSHAIGFGGIYSTNALEPIAFDGTKVSDTDADRTPGQISPLLEGDIDQLVTTVTSTAKTDFIENIVGSAHNDTITGNSLDNEIHASAGNDIIKGLGGNDTIHGGSGNDTITGGEGNDKLHGGQGADTYHFAKGHGQDTLWDSGNLDTQVDKLVFEGVKLDEAEFAVENGSLTVKAYGNNGDQLTVENFASSHRYMHFVFDDATVKVDAGANVSNI